MDMTWINFIQLVALPVIGWLAWFAWQAHAKADAARDSLNEYKLHVAREFATIGYLKDVEARLIATLEKIERAVSDIAREMRQGSK